MRHAPSWAEILSQIDWAIQTISNNEGPVVAGRNAMKNAMRRIAAGFALLLAAASSSASAATLHIVAFGDSATAGYLVPRAQAYPEQMQAALRKKGYDVAVSNAGVSGETSGGALKRFDRAIAPDTRIAIVEFGTNDLRLHVPARKMHANLNEIVRTLRARHRGDARGARQPRSVCPRPRQ
jgi:acyl-CoA thioesterase-1